MTMKKPVSPSPPPILSPRFRAGESSVDNLPVMDSTADILLVDDDPRTLMAMEALLAGPGRTIVTAQSGAEALRRVLRKDFALILLDVRMPDLDGFETAALIRQRERSRYTPIIFLSAVDTLETDVLKGASSGAVDYLFKPVVPDVLKSKVSVFVDLFHMNERLKQKAIQQGEERFRLAVEATPTAMIMVDDAGKIILANAHAGRLFGYTQQEMITHTIEELVPERVRSKHSDFRAAFSTDPTSRPMGAGRDLHGLRKDGAEVPVEIGLNPIQINDRTFVLASIIDITERKKAEEALRQQALELEQQLIASGRLVSLGEITASMAHEFNNPLGIIRGFAQDLLSEIESSHPQYRGLQIIEEETRRCEKIIRDLLEYSRPTSTEFRLTGVQEVVGKTLDMVGSHLYKQNVATENKVAKDLPSIHVDPQQLEQVLVNLYLNAIDAMPDGGKLIVGAQVKPVDGLPAGVILTVADTGFGIEEKDLPKIFQPFFTAKKKRGMGLGLPICDRIIRNHGGKIEVESQPGQGTTFTIHLPVEQKPAER